MTAGPAELLLSGYMLVGALNLISVQELSGPMEVGVKIRYRQTEFPALLEPHSAGTARVIFREPQAAVTPGQAAVFYQGDTVLGGGTVLRERP